jgi:hypothetical protein
MYYFPNNNPNNIRPCVLVYQNNPTYNISVNAGNICSICKNNTMWVGLFYTFGTTISPLVINTMYIGNSTNGINWNFDTPFEPANRTFVLFMVNNTFNLMPANLSSGLWGLTGFPAAVGLNNKQILTSETGLINDWTIRRPLPGSIFLSNDLFRDNVLSGGFSFSQTTPVGFIQWKNSIHTGNSTILWTGGTIYITYDGYRSLTIAGPEGGIVSIVPTNYPNCFYINTAAGVGTGKIFFTANYFQTYTDVTRSGNACFNVPLAVNTPLNKWNNGLKLNSFDIISHAYPPGQLRYSSTFIYAQRSSNSFSAPYINIGNGLFIDGYNNAISVGGSRAILSNNGCNNYPGPNYGPSNFSTFTGSATSVGLIRTTNNTPLKPTAANWSGYSDQKVKTDIQSADLERCYTITSSLKLSYYRYISSVSTDFKLNDTHMLGYIAQDVEQLFPKAVQTTNYNSSSILSLDLTQIQMAHYGTTQYMISSIQQRSTIIQHQFLEIQTLLGNYSTLVSLLSN